MGAAEFGCAHVMPLLVGLGADLSVVNSKGRTAMDIARKKNHWGCVRMLAHIHSSGSFDNLVELLAEHGPSIAALETEPDAGHSECDVLDAHFAEKGWHWTGQGRKEESHMQKICRLNFILYELVRLLNVKAELVKGVLYVATTGSSGIAWNGWYTTALHLAAELGADALVPLLVSLGADPAAKDSMGKTAMEVASAHQHWGCVWILSRLVAGDSLGDMESQQVDESELLRLRSEENVLTGLAPSPEGDDTEIPKPRFVD